MQEMHENDLSAGARAGRVQTVLADGRRISRVPGRQRATGDMQSERVRAARHTKMCRVPQRWATEGSGVPQRRVAVE